MPHIVTRTPRHTHIWDNGHITIDKFPVSWTAFSSRGIRVLDHHLSDQHLKTFPEVSTDFRLPNTHYWNYHRLLHCLHDILKPFPTAAITSSILTYLSKWGPYKGVVVGICKLLADHTYSSLVAAQLQLWWSGRLNIEYSDKHWSEMLAKHDRALREARLKLSYFKIMHRWHWTPKRLSDTGLLPGARCWRCQQLIVT